MGHGGIGITLSSLSLNHSQKPSGRISVGSYQFTNDLTLSSLASNPLIPQRFYPIPFPTGSPTRLVTESLFCTHQIKAAAKFTWLIRLTSTSRRDKTYHTMPDAIATRIKSRSTFAGTGLSGMRTRPFPGARSWFGRIVERSEWESRFQLNLMMLASARRLWCLISGRVRCLMRRDKGSLMLNLGLPEDEWNANMLREPFHG